MANFDKKDQKKRETVKKFEVQRKFLKALIKNQSLPQGLRYEYMLKLHKSCKKNKSSPNCEKMCFIWP